jgi:5-methylcytosine-specific restriction endonuclease McrA
MTRRYRDYTDEQIEESVRTNSSLSGVLKELGLKATGGNYQTMQRHIARLELDTSHWMGQGWAAGKKLKDWAEYVRSGRLKSHLIELRGHACEECGLDSWRDKLITLELEHVDGNNMNNELGNLKLLCPNCHSQTDTWRRNKKK